MDHVITPHAADALATANPSSRMAICDDSPSDEFADFLLTGLAVGLASNLVLNVPKSAGTNRNTLIAKLVRPTTMRAIAGA